MKKKFLSMLLISALVLSITACSNDSNNDVDDEEAQVQDDDRNEDEEVDDKEETTTTDAEETTTETTTAAPEETTVTTTEAPKVVAEVKNYNFFMNSCLSFSADGKNYVLNIADKKLYEHERDDIYAARGNVALFGNIVAYNDGIAYRSGVYNLETKEIIASAEENGIMPYSYWYGISEYIPVTSVKTDFDGNTYSVGLIDENGTWALPLSSDYAICDGSYLDLQLYSGNKNSSIIGIDSSASRKDLNSKIYDFKNNKFVELSGLVKDVSPECLNVLLCSGNNVLFYDTWSGSYFAKYNTDTNEFAAIGDGDRISMAYTSENGIALYDKANNNMMCFDSCLNEINFDFSEYTFGNKYIYNFNENIAVFNAKNTEGFDYIVILDKDGNRVTEPIIGTVDVAYISGDYVVLDELDYYDTSGNSHTNDYIINCKTGEIKSYAVDTYDIVGCDSATGTILVETDSTYYLADISDPDTLINPFEY